MNGTATQSADDDIYALKTPPGSGAIAKFLLDGPGLEAKLTPFFKPIRNKVLDWKRAGELLFGRFYAPDGGLLDEVVLAPLPATQSGTGHTQVECNVHGGNGVYRAVSACFEQLGIRAAKAWEFESRAHLRGKLSLIELEARRLLPHAATRRQLERALQHRAFQTFWEHRGLEIGLGMRQNELQWRSVLFEALNRALEGATASLQLMKTHHITLLGPANAGKSTLSNRLLRATRSIVSELPGTTRDCLTREAAIEGLSVRLSDTAGLRELESDNVQAAFLQIEAAGQRKALDTALQSDLVLIVLDASQPQKESFLQQIAALPAAKTLLVLNKADLAPDPDTAGLGFSLQMGTVTISARHDESLQALESAIAQHLLGSGEIRVETPFTERQKRHLEKIRSDLAAGVEPLQIVQTLRLLIGSRPNREELEIVLAQH